MRKKKIKYPFCTFMLLSVVVFWVAVVAAGYRVKLDGTFVKHRVQEEKKEEKKPVADQVVKEEKPAEEQADTEPEEKQQFVTVGMEYLDGALFIGDSRTSVLYEYAGWEKTHFFVAYGQTIWNVMDEVVNSDKTVGKISTREALKSQNYDKIYIMLGVNELGRGTADTFYEQYKLVIDEIRMLQPDARIFIQSILHVSEEKDSRGTYINNAEINARNEKIKTLEDGRQIFWLDVNEVFDEAGTGKLKQEYSSDGVHIKAKYISVWRDFLLMHGIENPL